MEGLAATRLRVCALLAAARSRPKEDNKKKEDKKQAKGGKSNGKKSEKKAGDASATLDRAEVNPVCGREPGAVRDEKFYLTTAINYTNGAPHMGHAYEAVTSDVICRYHRSVGRNVFFLTGSDEHGQKVERSAEKEGVSPQAIADRYSSGFKALNSQLGITNDFYIRTTSEAHKKLARELWVRVRAKGDIYLTNYEGWYNVHEECYVTDKEAEEKNFQDEHGRPFERKSEESYFFRMSKYKDALLKYINEENPRFIQPSWRRNEILSFLSEPLQDLCISRTVCQWGVQCPEDKDYKGDKSHVMYVWFDALTNYLSGINYLDASAPEASFWPASVHIIGKDIVRFHTVIWPCMLMSAGVPLPRAVFGHGFVNAADGVKMSKSVGNVVDPVELLKIYPSDTLRFYLARSARYGSDLPFSDEALCGMHNATLKDGFGNVLHRGTSLCKSICDGKVPSESPFLLDGDLPFDLQRLKTIYELAMALEPSKLAVDAKYDQDQIITALRREGADGLQMQAAGDACAEAINNLNQYLQTVAPWTLKGKDEETLAKKRAMVRATLEGVYAIAHFLAPFAPTAAAQVFHKLGVKQTFIPLLSNALDNLPPGTATYVGPVLFAEMAPGVGEVQRDVKAKKAGGGKEAYEKAQAAKKAKKAQAKAAQKKGGKGGASAASADAPEFTKMDLRVGKIVKAWHLEGSDKCFAEEVDVGEDAPRQIASGLRAHYSLDEFQGRLVFVACNLKPRKINGFPSNGMVLCATTPDKVELVEPPAGAKPGERVTLEGLDISQFPPEKPNVVERKKVWVSVAKKLATNGDCEACWDGKKITCSSGPLKSASLANTQLG